MKTFKHFVVEAAPPDPAIEKWIKDNKEVFKRQYGDNWEEVLYATAWKKHSEKDTKDEAVNIEVQEVKENKSTSPENNLKDKKKDFEKKLDDEERRARENEFKEKQREREIEFRKKEADLKLKQDEKEREKEAKEREAEVKKNRETSESIDKDFEKYVKEENLEN
jgi:hypothetical protein